MIKEFAANTVEKAKEEVSVSNGVIALIAVVAFLVGLVIGIIGTVNAQARRIKKKTFNAEEYIRDLDFEDEDDFDYEDEEYSC